MVRELRALEKVGQAISVTGLAGGALREQVPLASPAITAALSINGQRFLDPGRFVHALGRAVADRGARMRTLEVRSVFSSGSGITVYPRSGTPLTADTAVIATGAWLSRLAGGRVRVPVQAGRGYSFTVPVDRPIPGPIYLPDVRVACTPYHGALRVSGTMEFRDPHEPAIPARVGAIVASASTLLEGVRWAERSDIWVGPRPVTPDGRPLIGEMSRGVYVAGGHGMWGTGARPGDRPAAGRTDHHRQATRSAARLRPATPHRPLDPPLPLAVHTARENPRHGRPSRQGRRFRHRPAPDDYPYLNEKDTTDND
jgi:D-amino-acid dehydrogenase